MKKGLTFASRTLLCLALLRQLQLHENAGTRRVYSYLENGVNLTNSSSKARVGSAQKPLEGIFQNRSFDYSTSHFPPEYRGVLVDLPRNYMPLPFLKQVVRFLAARNLTVLHLRLSDDQGFVVNLPDQGLGTPSTRNGPLYTADELRSLEAFALEGYGVTIVPEINVPGHAGGWYNPTATVSMQKDNTSTMVVAQCPRVACRNAWSIPLDISRPDVAELVAQVVHEVTHSIFPNAPLVHLGGDEIRNALPCLREAGVREQERKVFEKRLRQRLEEKKTIAKDKNQRRLIIRWEESLQYAPDVVHVWMEKGYPPYCQGASNTTTGRQCILSQLLYWDKNDIDVWEIYQNTVQTILHRPFGVIACPWELDVHAWMERNIWGNIVAYSMAMAYPHLSEPEFRERYWQECSNLLRNYYQDQYPSSAAQQPDYPAAVCYNPMPYKNFLKRFHWREAERDSLVCNRISNGTLPCQTHNCNVKGSSPDVTMVDRYGNQSILAFESV